MPHFYNTRAGGYTFVAISVLLSLVLGLLQFFTALPIPLWFTLLPVVQLAARVWLYTLMMNAGHEALRLAEADAMLDDQMFERGMTGTVNSNILNAKTFGDTFE